MKALPTVVSSADGKSAVALLEFEGRERISNRDAHGYYYTIRRDPTEETSRIAVLFSGTVQYIDLGFIPIPDLGSKEKQFTAIAEAAIGDYLTEYGLPEPTPSGVSAAKIECFSPHFQQWHDRAPADDEEIEAYLQAHVLWAWKFSQAGWLLGPSDCLRLHQPLGTIKRIVALGVGEEWTATDRAPHEVWLEPTPKFLRAKRETAVRTRPGKAPVETESSQGPAQYVYVDEIRVAELKRIASSKFDLQKLVYLCDELNQCYRSQCYYAVAALTRAVLDHVPPIFQMRTFSEVANNYKGSRSFKECMQRLEGSARSIADLHLHSVIRQKESLPTRTQVNFSNDLDLLLAEVVCVLEAEGNPE